MNVKMVIFPQNTDFCLVQEQNIVIHQIKLVQLEETLNFVLKRMRSPEVCRLEERQRRML